MRGKKIWLLLVMGLLIVLLTACGSKKMTESKQDNMDAKGSGTANGVAYDSGSTNGDPKYGSVNNGTQETTAAATNITEDKFKASAENELTSSSVLTSNESALNANDKIIRRVNMQVETQEFDTLIKTIDSKINQLGGYVESSNISGRNYYSDNMRDGNIVARVPKDKLNTFINTVSDNANVIQKGESTTNVTLDYSDIESHKKALVIEQDRLLVLIDKAKTLEDIITLESRLSDIRYQLQNFETQLRTYDNQVEYSTITLYIQEVERMTVVSEKKKTVWNRINNGFSDTVFNISEGFKNFVVWFAVNFLYLLIWAIIIVVVVIISRRFLGIKKVKNIKQHEDIIDKEEKDSIKIKEDNDHKED